MVLFLMGKFAITISFTVVYVYTTEMFPTEIRHSLLGVCAMVGRIGSMIAPQTPLLVSNKHTNDNLSQEIKHALKLMTRATPLSIVNGRGS
jgi:hypothetical protein